MSRKKQGILTLLGVPAHAAKIIYDVEVGSHQARGFEAHIINELMRNDWVSRIMHQMIQSMNNAASVGIELVMPSEATGKSLQAWFDRTPCSTNAKGAQVEIQMCLKGCQTNKKRRTMVASIDHGRRVDLCKWKTQTERVMDELFPQLPPYKWGHAATFYQFISKNSDGVPEFRRLASPTDPIIETEYPKAIPTSYRLHDMNTGTEGDSISIDGGLLLRARQQIKNAGEFKDKAKALLPNKEYEHTLYKLPPGTDSVPPASASCIYPPQAKMLEVYIADHSKRCKCSCAHCIKLNALCVTNDVKNRWDGAIYMTEDGCAHVSMRPFSCVCK